MSLSPSNSLPEAAGHTFDVPLPRDIETVELTTATGMTLQRIRAWKGEVDAVTAQLDHVRCNVLMRKGLVVNLGPGKWAATARGRAVAIRFKDRR